MGRVLFVLANTLALATHAAAFLLVAGFVAVAAFADTGLVHDCINFLGGL